MPTTLATLDAVTKEVYEGSLREQLNNEVKTLRRIEKTSDGTTTETGGRYVTFPIHTRRNTGIGARSEGEPLPVAGNQGTAAARVGLKYQYGAVQLTGQAIELIDKNYQAFISAMDLEMDGLRRDLAIDLNRQVYGDGTGALATLTANTAAANTITVDDVRLLQLGMKVDLNTGSTTDTAGRLITAINTATKVVTLDGAAFSAATGDIVLRTGNYDREWTGFKKIVSDSGVLFNIDPAVEPVWKAQVNHNSGVNRAVSESLFTTMADNIYESGGGNPTVIFYTVGIRRAYAALLQAQRQYVNTKTFTGGFEGLGFVTDNGEIPMVTDYMAPKNTAWFINEKEIKLYRTHDWSWMDRDGSKWKQKTDSNGEYDAWGARLYQYSELGTGRRNTHGVIKDITEA